jgi:hypothetical protein
MITPAIAKSSKFAISQKSMIVACNDRPATSGTGYPILVNRYIGRYSSSYPAFVLMVFWHSAI